MIGFTTMEVVCSSTRSSSHPVVTIVWTSPRTIYSTLHTSVAPHVPPSVSAQIDELDQFLNSSRRYNNERDRPSVVGKLDWILHPNQMNGQVLHQDIDPNTPYDALNTKDFINDIFGIIRFLYYEYGLIFGVDLYIEFFQITKIKMTLVNDFKYQQTHSPLQRYVINDSKCQRTHSQLQRILLVDSSLNFYLTHC